MDSFRDDIEFYGTNHPEDFLQAEFETDPTGVIEDFTKILNEIKSSDGFFLMVSCGYDY